jgi:hypothetical protein
MSRRRVSETSIRHSSHRGDELSPIGPRLVEIHECQPSRIAPLEQEGEAMRQRSVARDGGVIREEVLSPYGAGECSGKNFLRMRSASMALRI